MDNENPITDISIHAPRAGCDDDLNGGYIVLVISIHAPRAGCDQVRGRVRHRPAISIHAPRAGCDTAAEMQAIWDKNYFNPRTPCGVRLHLCRAARLDE